jgi:hypothetical protein
MTPRERPKNTSRIAGRRSDAGDPIKVRDQAFEQGDELRGLFV